MAAEAQDAGFVLSTLSSVALEMVAKAAGSRRWFQLYLQRERTHTLDLVHRAEAAGYKALVITVDAPINGLRNREHRVGFKLPPHVSAENLAGYGGAHPSGEVRPMEFFMTAAPTWSDIAWVCGNTRLPVLVKGILADEDADLAFEHGARGVIVSNHGGGRSTLRRPPLMFFPMSSAASPGAAQYCWMAASDAGTDVLKCIAAGATAVLVGRPIAYGLAVAGALGVSHVLRILRDELEIAMALTGCMRLAEAQPNQLRRQG